MESIFYFNQNMARILNTEISKMKIRDLSALIIYFNCDITYNFVHFL